MVISDCPNMSIKPGATTLPWASMVRVRASPDRLPMAAIFPPRMPMSPEYQGEPDPSMMWPLVMTRSKAGLGTCAKKWGEQKRKRIPAIKSFVSIREVALFIGGANYKAFGSAIAAQCGGEPHSSPHGVLCF